jgi:hypothetical protein
MHVRVFCKMCMYRCVQGSVELLCCRKTTKSDRASKAQGQLHPSMACFVDASRGHQPIGEPSIPPTHRIHSTYCMSDIIISEHLYLICLELMKTISSLAEAHLRPALRVGRTAARSGQALHSALQMGLSRLVLSLHASLHILSSVSICARKSKS